MGAEVTGDFQVLLRTVLCATLVLGCGAAAAQELPRLRSLFGSSAASSAAPAKALFGAATSPAPLSARAIGSYSRGCLAGGVALPVNGPGWQVMRLSRNRNFGHPRLVAYLEALARDARRIGWPGLLVGDMAQPRGGPMLTGHSSHQIGLDADIWLTPMPNRVLTRSERENMTAVSMLRDPLNVDRDIWTMTHTRLIKLAASYAEVERIFVHPAIKQALCDQAGQDRAWLDTLFFSVLTGVIALAGGSSSRALMIGASTKPERPGMPSVSPAGFAISRTPLDSVALNGVVAPARAPKVPTRACTSAGPPLRTSDA